MKKITLFLMMLPLIFSCEQDIPLTDNIPTSGVVLTNLDLDHQAQILFGNLLANSPAGRVPSDVSLSEIFKYFDVEKNIVNYSVILRDTSNAYFENLVVSKIGDDFLSYPTTHWEIAFVLPDVRPHSIAASTIGINDSPMSSPSRL